MPDCNGEPARHMWQAKVPQFAHQTEIVLDPVMALSALHLHSQQPEDPTLGLVVYKYLDRTLVNYQRALPHLDGNLGEPLFLAAVVLSNIMWLLCHNASANKEYRLPLPAYALVRGVTILYLRNHSLLQSLGYGWFGQEDMLAVDGAISAEHAQKFLIVQSDLDKLVTGLQGHLSDPVHRVACEQAKDYVLWLYKAYYSGASERQLRRFVGTMPARLPAAFMGLLEKHDVLAMSLLGRSLTVLHLLKRQWWIHGAGGYEVAARDITGISRLLPKESRWAMELPMLAISGRLDLAV